jgi:hypothetical protein
MVFKITGTSVLHGGPNADDDGTVLTRCFNNTKWCTPNIILNVIYFNDYLTAHIQLRKLQKQPTNNE